jgi:hypothetical protein
MERLRTRLDLVNKCVYWRINGSKVETPSLNSLLKANGLAFDSVSSKIHVWIKDGDRVLAKLVYTVEAEVKAEVEAEVKAEVEAEVKADADADADAEAMEQITIDGLFGRFTGPMYDTIVGFGNRLVAFAESNNAKCLFIKYYYAISKDSTSVSDLDSDTDQDLGPP